MRRGVVRPRIRHYSVAVRATMLEQHLRVTLAQRERDVAYLASLKGDPLAVAWILREAAGRMQRGLPAEPVQVAWASPIIPPIGATLTGIGDLCSAHHVREDTVEHIACTLPAGHRGSHIKPDESMYGGSIGYAWPRE